MTLRKPSFPSIVTVSASQDSGWQWLRWTSGQAGQGSWSRPSSPPSALPGSLPGSWCWLSPRGRRWDWSLMMMIVKSDTHKSPKPFLGLDIIDPWSSRKFVSPNSKRCMYVSMSCPTKKVREESCSYLTQVQISYVCIKPVSPNTNDFNFWNDFFFTRSV